MIIDATDTILGRLASTAASALREGDEVHVVNAEQAVVTGEQEDVYDKYRQKREVGNRDHGPRFPKAPDRIVKRTVRGMLPDNSEGRDAFKRLRTYRGNPEDMDPHDDDIKRASDLKGDRYVTVEQISNHI